MPTTTNFGWTTPADTDLVKDGALAIRTLGNGVDTSFLDLKGGTTGQVLSKASNTDLDFTWVAQDDSNAIQNAIVDAKGDLIAATANDTPARLAVGANGTVLTADSAEATGLKWATPSSGGMTLLSTTALTGASVTVSSISTAYNDLKLVFEDTYSASDGVFLRLRFNGDTGTNYAWENYSTADGQAAGSGSTNADYAQVSKIRNSSTLASDGFVLLSNYTKSAGTVPGISSFSYSDEHIISGGAMYQNAAAITSVTVFMSSGNISGGSLKIYGVK